MPHPSTQTNKLTNGIKNRHLGPNQPPHYLPPLLSYQSTPIPSSFHPNPSQSITSHPITVTVTVTASPAPPPPPPHWPRESPSPSSPWPAPRSPSRSSPPSPASTSPAPVPPPPPSSCPPRSSRSGSSALPRSRPRWPWPCTARTYRTGPRRTAADRPTDRVPPKATQHRTDATCALWRNRPNLPRTTTPGRKRPASAPPPRSARRT
mmetsp:Transcript_12000/g.24999  ORF Transcript_12000/g.24999 Transcript_12000/m.24999 type:complete len:207 (+) Transcript_12000:78-698(+)